jgi:hypothetical protein
MGLAALLGVVCGATAARSDDKPRPARVFRAQFRRPAAAPRVPVIPVQDELPAPRPLPLPPQGLEVTPLPQGPLIGPPALRPAPPIPIPTRPPTLREFAAGFQPIPGTHKVVVMHPRTCAPVCVTFCLPPGCPKIEVQKDEIRFDYGKYDVEIEFRKNGRVEVEYDD